jgi:hypothetical protein
LRGFAGGGVITGGGVNGGEENELSIADKN